PIGPARRAPRWGAGTAANCHRYVGSAALAPVRNCAQANVGRTYVCPSMTSLNFRFANQAERSPGDLSAEVVEHALVDRIRAGDMDAFETLYRSYWQPLYAFAFRYVRSKPDAEDVTQEVFLRIWRGRADWLPRSEEHTSELQSRSDLVC